MSIFNSNDYKRGYEEGYAAGLEMKDKSYIRMGMTLKFAIHGQNALETYTKGYNDGYRKGVEDRHSKIQPQKVVIVEQTKTILKTTIFHQI